MSSRSIVVVSCCVIIAGSTVSVASQQVPTAAATGLEALFEPGELIQDRNGDQVVDFVDASLLTGESPSDAELVAAANVAARLGYETMAMDLPLPRQATGGFRIMVGEGGMRQASLTAQEVGLAGLAEGSGIVAHGPQRLVVAGVDADGLIAASEYLAGRFPHIWDLEGAELADVVQALRARLDQAGAASAVVAVRSVSVRASTAGLQRLDAEVAVASESEAEMAIAALNEFAAEPIEEPGAEPGADAPETATSRLSRTGFQTLRVSVVSPQAAARVVEIPGRLPEPVEPPVPGRPGAGPKQELDLSTLYAIDGLLGDSDGNLIPDRVDALVSAAGTGVDGAVDIAARLGLESTGIVIPAAKTAASIDDPSGEPTMVLVGREHPLVGDLVDGGELTLPDLAAGQGLIQVVDDAFGGKPAVVVTGGDEAGLRRATAQLAERLPFLWDRGKDRPTLDQVEDDLYRFLSGRSPAGQAATALYKLEQVLDELEGQAITEASVSVHVEKAEPGLDALVRQRIGARLGGAAEVSVHDIDVQNAELLHEEELEVGGEVADFWELFRARVLPRVGSGDAVELEVRLSEPPSVRERIHDQVMDALGQAGADASSSSVHVLSAYKQGYSWLYDVVRPALEGEPVEELVLRFAEAGPPPQWQQQAMYTPTRWLKETFPIDEVLARELAIPIDDIRFEMTPVGTSPTYEVVARAGDGSDVYTATFDPKYVVRPYFDQFPNYEKVRVTTGWINARVGGEVVADERIVTDPERFWDHFQSQTLPSLYEYVMEIADGKPRPSDAPHFGELRVELTLSEPDYRVGVDQEQISSVESLHEEIYFGTLHFFDVVGRIARGAPLDYPGRVIPVSRAKSDGEAGSAKITFTGFRSPRPAVVVGYRDAEGQEHEIRRDILPVAMERPRALAATVREDRAGIERLDLRVKVDFETDRRAEFVLRTRADTIDSTIISAEQVRAYLDNLGRLRDAGIYRNALAYPGLEGLRVTAAWEWEADPETETVVEVAGNGVPDPLPDVAALLPAAYSYEPGDTIVQWDTPIPPPEAYEILAKMSTFPEATVYKVGHSYLGKDIWAMDLVPPIEASHVSQAKATTLKPTVVYSARQHANEVSSTSHVLKLAEMLLTDPEWRPALDDVNVVIHPITNPDGAQLAYDLYRITPDQMLHAGYLGSLGVDVTANSGDPDPIYPETKVRSLLWRTWLPDIFLNPHGYPSHEWVQMFSEYAAWVRNRITEARDWWGMRGWFIPGFSYLEDREYPRHEDAAMQIRQRITENINAVPELRALNERAYDRYRRYGFAFDKENFHLDFTNDVLIYTPVKGTPADGGPGSFGDFMVRNPKVTIWTGGTEAPDETAYGDWLQLVATAGLQWDKAILEYLWEGDHRVHRRSSEFWGGVSLSLDRPRPPETEGDTAASDRGSEGR